MTLDSTRQQSPSPLSPTAKIASSYSSLVPSEQACLAHRATVDVREATVEGEAEFPSLDAASSAPDSSSQLLNDSTHAVLHRCCQLFAQDADHIQNALLSYPRAIHQRACLPVLTGQLSLQSLLLQQSSQKSFYEPYTLPLNIALMHKATPEVVSLLIGASCPSLLLEMDGVAGLTPLAVALGQYDPFHRESSINSIKVIELILEANHEALKVPTEQDQNLPLHLACLYGAPLELLRLVVTSYPAALGMRNKHGQTPLDLALSKNNGRPRSACYPSVVLYLQLASAKQRSEAEFAPAKST